MNRFDTSVCRFLIAASVFVLFVQTVGAQTGKVQKEENCPVLKPYAELDKFGKFYFPEAVYEEARTQTDYECRHIWYLSDDIPVSGYIFKPKATRGTILPAILYNRAEALEISASLKILCASNSISWRKRVTSYWLPNIAPSETKADATHGAVQTYMMS